MVGQWFLYFVLEQPVHRTWVDAGAGGELPQAQSCLLSGLLQALPERQPITWCTHCFVHPSFLLRSYQDRFSSETVE
jgi:hypothetical protein